MSCRKKIDSKIWIDYWTMETEVRSLKQELTSTRDALKSATKRCRELVRELDSLHVCHDSERNLRDQQLSKILRALLILESRLRQEQKSIRQQLCEKDTVIRNQQIEIARLRRYTKNYIKNKREQDSYINITEDVNKNTKAAETILSSFDDNTVAKDIQQLKREIIIKLNNCEDDDIKNKEFGVKKTDSFAGSDVSKESVTSENTDASIVTTTTEGSPSLLSTEGFCEGESSDISPGSTLNKSCRRIISETDPQVTINICQNDFNFKDNNNDDDADDQGLSQRRLGIIRSEPLEIYENEVAKISRSDSKDDGMDCNFASDEDEAEPIYVNACAGNENKNNNKNLRDDRTRGVQSDDNRFNNNNNSTSNNNNNNINIINNNETAKIEEEKCMEDTSGNWYSDPDEDRITEEVIQNNSYRPNSNHNSVLECVNQILLRDREEEENVRSIPRTFKHKGRIVRFQPARLSDIESVGSEMERKNSEEAIMDKENELGDAGSEEEYGMRIMSPSIMRIGNSVGSADSNHEEELDTSTGAIPIAIIEPQIDIDAQSVISSVSSVSPELSVKSRSSNRSSSPILRLERIEEKTCLSMSSKGLTIAKNLDYEDIESLPEIISPLPKTPPALPPKPQFRNNTLVLKKIPSPSFLIDETRKKHSSGLSAPGYVKKIFGISTPSKSSLSSSSKSLLFDNDHLNKSLTRSPGLNFINNNSFKESIFRSPKKDKQKDLYRDTPKIPRVPNMVRHFEEFKIGNDIDSRCVNKKSKDRSTQFEIEEIDIRQNFEEFNLDECDLSDDPDRPEGDGSDRLGNLALNKNQDDDIYSVVDNNNTPTNNSTSSAGTTTNSNTNTNSNSNGIYDHFLEATGLSNKSILTPSRLLSNHKSVLKPKDVKYKNKIKAVSEKQQQQQIVNPLPAAGINNNSHSHSNSHSHTHGRHWTGPFV
ncbi:probable serine/threonine-protein kinase DDB_G0267686 isoform X2 [Microplitis demolitor]|uniref:probable serine/threonine-protein kinase DDB_G0267686 isoform X2 n=1 Tax=Microplitis demolitor TaxID=69319 RepID=UPI0004CD4E5B|nr:probable serine/threonine-protein kinase DDB_G0267686 isoform X2 [Microplitis demolitor]